jgi:cytidyltransferase-like protein
MYSVKIKKINQLSSITESIRRSGRKSGLITGCFDVLHIGHIDLFRFSKQHADFLIVGLDNDRSIALSKGRKRPIFNERIRLEQIAELESVDFVFLIEDEIGFGNNKSSELWENIVKAVEPDCIITSRLTDKFFLSKKEISTRLGIEFYEHIKPIPSSTSFVADEIMKTS